MLLKNNGSLPLYEQVKKYLEQKIVSREWEQGYKIPTEKELSELFQVSTITIKRAVLDLVDSGHLYRKSGKGTFVNYQEKTDLSKFVSIQNKFDEGKKYPHKIIGFNKIKPDSEVRENLKLAASDKVYHISRLKLENGIPSIIEDSFIPVNFAPNLTQEDIENELLYNIFLKKYGLPLDKAKVFISTKAADRDESSLLNIPIGCPLLVLDRCTTLKEERVVEYSRCMSVFKNAEYFLEINL
ncbi:GntR family transcriptional regulator [Oceanobacillus sp. J11TS1]|uniref:GntR family transcriptional regulator n=1 Tax=Oceanobacillus sp. J11TS1 TaxID=2807191 RepID=UPI001B0AEE00|nr:GntR family transcriptional regulator [Oceanobacillus sp. J11TS1]GIO23803.1 GntR family transcriptional regulator [Oceanobacillus sp. J11TS1]